MAKKTQKSRHIAQLKLFGLSLFAGGCLAVPFLHYQLGWLIFVAFLPYIWLLQQLGTNNLSKRSQVGYIWLSGWTMLLGVTYWMVQTQPERWASLNGWWAICGLVMSYMFFSSILSLGFVVMGVIYVWAKPQLSQKRIFALLPAIWILGELARSWIFSIIAWGPNSTLGPNWNFGNFGFAASVSPLVYAGRFVGLFGVSFLVIVTNLCIWWLLHKRWKLPVLLLCGITLLSATGWFAYRHATGPEVRAAALQLGSNDSLQIGAIDYHGQLAKLAQPKSIDVLVLSEYSDIFNDQSKASDIAAMQQSLRDNNVPIITSRQRSDNNKMYNTVTVYRSDSSIGYEHDKQFLIPVGEAMPLGYTVIFNLLGQKQAVDTAASGREISKGQEPAHAYKLDGLWIGSMACSGAISPELYRGLVVDGAQILSNSASLSIFIKAPTYHQQAQQMARFMAVANARPFVQATDGSYSFMLDHNGQWLAKSGQKDLQLLQHNVVTNTRRTVYSLLGEWVVVASIVVVVCQLVYVYKKS